jgi:hypothetical protein
MQYASSAFCKYLALIIAASIAVILHLGADNSRTNIK